MQNIHSWESKFQPCQYSEQLLNLIAELNTSARIPADALIIKKATYYAIIYHGNQTRKSGEPYYSHPLIVAYLFVLYFGKKSEQYYTTELIVIAILHDTIEDTKLTYEMIVEIFGKLVADGVRDLSRITIDGVKHAASDTLDSLNAQGKIGLLYVKLCDRVHNMQTIGPMPITKQKRIIKETATDFIVSSANLTLYEIEEELWELCSIALKKTNILKDDLIEDNSLLLSLGFQSDLSQNQNPKL